VSKQVYIAGPMRGHPEFNFPAFDAAALLGRQLGFRVISPAEMDREAGINEKKKITVTPSMCRTFAARDLHAILCCDAIALLPGWRKSVGATAEMAAAKWIGLEVLDATTFEPLHETAVQEAQRICYGDRGDDYGHPLEECERMARLWGPILGTHVTPSQVCLCLIQMKVSREINKPKRDNRVDIAGYAECLNRIHEKLEAVA
jgi:hypothetical protein